MLRAEQLDRDQKAEQLRLEALAAAKAISPDEYEQWLPPRVAIKMLEPLLPEPLAKTEVYNRLCGGEILSVARTANWYHQSTVETKDLGKLGAFIWQMNKLHDHDLFWSTGTHKLSRPLHHSSSTRHPVECFGIRFEPGGVQKVLRDSGVDLELAKPSPSEGSGAIGEESKSSVSKADLARWHEIFAKLHPDAPEALALRSAVALFPDNHVPRQWVRDLRGPQKRGKPTNRH